MGKKLVRKALEMIRQLADDQDAAVARKKKKAKKAAAASEEKKEGEDAAAEAEDDDDETPLAEGADTAYTKFWETYAKNIKLGIIEDASNRSKLGKLLRYRTTSTEKGEWRSLDAYIAAMKEGQKQIYYIAGESLEAIKSSPFLERFASAGLEVIYMTDPVDEYVTQHMSEFEGHRLQSITKEGLVLPGGEEAAAKRREAAYKEGFKPLTGFLKGIYGDKVDKVVVSSRLANAPCVIVTSQYGYSANLERLMRSQAFADPSKKEHLVARKTMEINPRHPVMVELNNRLGDDEAAKASVEQNTDLANLLYDSALLNSGFSMDDTKSFSARMYRLMQTTLNLPDLELQPEIEVPAEEDGGDDEEEEDDDEEGGDEDEL
jgi:heat shock protein 90kDa beta